MVKYVTDMNEFQTLKKGDKLLVVDFTASWCVQNTDCGMKLG